MGTWFSRASEIEELRAEGKIAELEQKYFGESLSDYLK